MSHAIDAERCSIAREQRCEAATPVVSVIS
jgi:hypothetical protein